LPAIRTSNDTAEDASQCIGPKERMRREGEPGCEPGRNSRISSARKALNLVKIPLQAVRLITTFGPANEKKPLKTPADRQGRLFRPGYETP
jgi:hypothetical protein